jgi:hypothetical protein
MTEIKKKAKDKKGVKAKKLRLTKETLRDLSAGGRGQVKGGRARAGSVAGICLPSQGCT